MSQIRVRYSTIINIIAGMVTAVTGLAHIMIMTRTLSVEEFGTWSLVMGMIAYLLMFESITNFWIVRQTARGEGVGGTGVASSLLFAVAAIPVYLAYAYHVSDHSNAVFEGMVAGVVLVPVFFASFTLDAINRGYKPHAMGVGGIVFGASKVVLVAVLVLGLHYGIVGAILAVLLAYGIKIIVQIWFARSVLKDRFNPSVLKRWLHMSPIRLYFSLSRYARDADVLIFPILVGSVTGMAYHGAALAIAGIVMLASGSIGPVYSKILSQNSYARGNDHLSFMLYFLMPLTVLAILFAEPGLSLFGGVYQSAHMIAVLFAIRSFMIVLRMYFEKILTGMAEEDLGEVSLARLFGGVMFRNISILMAQSFVYLGLLVAVVYTYGGSVDELDLVTWWAALAVLCEIPAMVIFGRHVYKKTGFAARPGAVARYAASAALMAVLYAGTSGYLLAHTGNVYDLVTGLLIQAALCAGLYLGVTYALDAKTRNLFRGIVAEISGMARGSGGG